jgi:hypothetical protein
VLRKAESKETTSHDNRTARYTERNRTSAEQRGVVQPEEARARDHVAKDIWKALHKLVGEYSHEHKAHDDYRLRYGSFLASNIAEQKKARSDVTELN